MERHFCDKCNYTWLNRIKKKPKQCPHCKSKQWNEIQEKREQEIIKDRFK